MSTIRNKERAALFDLLSIDLEKSRGRWKIIVGEKRIGKTYATKVQAIRAARRIRQGWLRSLQEHGSESFRLMEQFESQFFQIASGATEDHPFG